MKAQGPNPWLIAFVVSLATFMEVLDTTITNVSLRHIASALGAGQDEGTWALTAYLVANGIILPLSGWLSEVVGRKRYFIACILGFTLSSFFCGAAMSLPELILFRILQGASGGGLQPTQQAIILDTFPPEKRSAVFAITGVTMIVAPILGPTLGGLITDNFSWRWIFYINLPVGLFSAFMVWRLVQDLPHTKARGFQRIDFVGLTLVMLGLAAFQIMLDRGQQYDWLASPFIMTWAVTALVCLGTAGIWLWEREDAIIDLTLFKDWSFTTSCMLIFLTGFVLYGSSILLPLLLQSVFDYNATLAGLVLSPSGVIVMFLMPISAKLIGLVESRYLILIGLSLVTIGLFYTAHLTPQTDYATFTLMRVVQVLGLPFLFIPISTLAFSNISPERRNKASALFSMFRNMGGSIGIAVGATYLLRQQQVHQHFLSEHLFPGNLPYEKFLQQVELHTGNLTAAFGYVYHTLQIQASVLAYAETFQLLGYIVLGSALVAFCVLPANVPANRA